MVVNHFDLRKSTKTTKEGNSFKSNNSIPWQVRLWMRRKSLASKAIRKVKTITGCRRFKEKILEAQKELSKSSYKRKVEEENSALNQMKLNPNIFIHTSKRKQNQNVKLDHLSMTKERY